MAHQSAKSRLFNELSRNRTSSPNTEEFATAGSFDVNNDQIINSTINIDNPTTTHDLPMNYENPYQPSEPGSDGSAEMSIELGRGAKRGVRDQDVDISSNITLNFGGDSQHEATTPPQARSRNVSKKNESTLRREASLRNAAAAAKSSLGGLKSRSLSETVAKLSGGDTQDDALQPTATFNSRNTRFTRARQVSAPSQESTPRRAALNNQTVQSASYTANSFMLPDLPNITELVSGVRNDGTPVFSRTTKPTRSRFTSGTYKPIRLAHAPIESVPIPDEEKAIWSSLQLLKDKVAALEQEKAEADKRAEEYESEIIELRSQLSAERRRPDSALGSDEEGASDRWRNEKTKLQATIKALQDRLNRSERKISISEISVKRISKERDELVTQIGVAYFNNEELKVENETLREGYAQVQDENESLREQLEELRKQLGQYKNRAGEGITRDRRASRAHSEVLPGQQSEELERIEPRAGKRRSIAVDLQQSQEDIASKIAREVQRHRDEANVGAKAGDRSERHTIHRDATHRSRSKSQQRRTSVHKRAISVPLEVEASDVDLTMQQEMTQKTKETLKNMNLPGPTKPRISVFHDEDSRDLTLLSLLDPLEVAKLRQKLEEERRAGKEKRNSSAPDTLSHGDREDTVRSAARDLTRKSSLKDITARLDNETSHSRVQGEVAEALSKKSVRVQSPRTDDICETSMLSNTSRRRRRGVESTEGMTSAFILPDITMHASNRALPNVSFSTKACIQHHAESCTVCHPGEGKVDIPTPIPVTDREVPQDPDITTATVRPAQAPPLALATVIKQLNDEITHLKIRLAEQQRRYHQHDPALSKRQRIITSQRMESLQKEIDKKSDQIYALYDVLEGQKQAAGNLKEDEVEQTLMSVGIDPAELSGRVGRKAPAPMGFDGADDGEYSESEELPWEGLSEDQTEE